MKKIYCASARRSATLARHPIVIASAMVCLPYAAFAQSTVAPARVGTLPTVTVTGNPLRSSDLIAPAAAYSGTGLLLRSRSTLGETLDGTPGVSSTYFGPNSSRPAIRGLDGDRIRILQNSGASVDASGLSYDHAVPSDPIAIERIEVLRGPGALLYGGSAVGGVVNLIDNRIPREPLFDANGGIAGRADLGFASANREKAGAVSLETGNNRYALHVDAFNRNARDVSVPVALACTKPGSAALANRICNSAADTHGGALGGSAFFGGGYLGASVSTYRSSYGTVAEDEVLIGMKSDRLALEGELRGLTGPVQSIKGQFSRSDYQHTEFEAGVIGTVFKNKGNDLRLEARHAKLGPIEGVIGIQSENTRFSADGAEAFAPYSQTRQNALFIYEEIAAGWGRVSLGARTESVRIESFGNPIVARFAPASRSFSPRSYALGGLFNLAAGWQLTGNLATSERAPKDYELFADGPHIATGSYEVGNPAFSKERSSNLDVGVAWKSGANRFALGGFVNRFKNYLALDATGLTRDTDGNGAGVGVTDDGFGNSIESGGTAGILPEYAYSQVRARFTGIEANGSVRLLEGPQTVDLELRGDLVRATNRSTGQYLPRIAPARVGATLMWAQGPWGARFGVSHAAAQNKVPAGQLTTSSYTLANAAVTYQQTAGRASLLWYLQLDNIGDVLAYSASSILTQIAPGKSPLTGRSLKLGLQASF